MLNQNAESCFTVLPNLLTVHEVVVSVLAPHLMEERKILL